MSASIRDRALSILELLVRCPRGLPMSDVATQLDIPRTAAHRLLHELRASGYLRQTDGGNFVLTVKLAALGLSYMANNGISDATQPLLEELARETGELVRLAIIEDTRLIWVAKAQGAQTGLRYDPDTGAEVYLPASASGLAWLAEVSEERALELLASQGMGRAASMGPGAPRTLREVLGLIKVAHERGYGEVHDSYEPGTSAFSAVLRHHLDNTPIGTISVAGPSVRITRSRIEVLAPILIEYAARLSELSRTSPLFVGR